MNIYDQDGCRNDGARVTGELGEALESMPGVARDREALQRSQARSVEMRGGNRDSRPTDRAAASEDGPDKVPDFSWLIGCPEIRNSQKVMYLGRVICEYAEDFMMTAEDLDLPPDDRDDGLHWRKNVYLRPHYTNAVYNTSGSWKGPLA